MKKGSWVKRLSVLLCLVIVLIFSQAAWSLWKPFDIPLEKYVASPQDRSYVRITSDMMPEQTLLKLELNSDHSIRLFRFVIDETSTIDFGVPKLLGGAVLRSDIGLSGENLSTLILKSDGFDAQKGGELKLIYLVNGTPFFFQEKEFVMNLLLNKEGEWVFQDGAQGRPFNVMSLHGNYFFRQLVGISSIDVMWDEQIQW